MTSTPKGTAPVTGETSGFGTAHHFDHFESGNCDPGSQQLGKSFEAAQLNLAHQSLVVAYTPPRILLVDAALALQKLHLLLLRSIPAIVESMASCADMYLHGKQGYVLVILALQSESRETAEAAHFVRHRWSTARILLLENESALIDEWLYDERIDPHLHPAEVLAAAIRLMNEKQ